MLNSGRKWPVNLYPTELDSTQNENTHWVKTLTQVTIKSNKSETSVNFTINGGSDNGEFIYVSHIDQNIVYTNEFTLFDGDTILTIQGQHISGFTKWECEILLERCFKNSAFIFLTCVPQGKLIRSLRKFLYCCFPRGSADHGLQNIIRDNLYVRTVPITTRPPRIDEIDGVNYIFLSIEEFKELERNGHLIESGVYEGNYYGTPKPPKSPSIVEEKAGNTKTISDNKNIVLRPYQTLEYKRKRNRSNVEAMSAKNSNHDMPQKNGDCSKDELGRSTQRKSPPSYYYESGVKYADNLDDDQLGPLPPKWEKAFTDKGEVYFIDHNSSTSHWLDPRLSKVQKKSLEDCSEHELPYGWERIDDPLYGTYYIDHVNRQTQYENPVLQAKYAKTSVPNENDYDDENNFSSRIHDQDEQEGPYRQQCMKYANTSSKFDNGSSDSNFFTKNPDELVGEMVKSTLVKSYRGLGFAIVGGDDTKEEFLQIKSVVPNGPAWYEGKLQTGDVLVYVNKICVLGYTHHDMVSVFQSILPGQIVEIEVCRGYPLRFDPNDPNTDVVTTIAVGNPGMHSGDNVDLNRYLNRDAYLKSDVLDDTNDITNHSVKSMPDLYSSEKIMNIVRPSSTDLILDEDCKPQYLSMTIVKGSMGFGFTIADSAYGQKVKKILDKQRCGNLSEGDILLEINNRCVRNMCHGEVVQVLKDCTKNEEATITVQRINSNISKSRIASNNQFALAEYQNRMSCNDRMFHKPPNQPKLPDVPGTGLKYDTDMYQTDDNANVQRYYSPCHSPRNELERNDNSWNSRNSYTSSNNFPHPTINGNYHDRNDICNEPVYNSEPHKYFFPGSLTRKQTTSFEHEQPINDVRQYRRQEMSVNTTLSNDVDTGFVESFVTIHRQEAGFGFRIVGGTEEGSQVSIGHIVEGGAAELNGLLQSGDEIITVDNQSVLNSSHHHVVQLMGKAANNGKVTLGIRRRIGVENKCDEIIRSHGRYPHDVTVTRRENEGFGFVIISSLNKAGSTIGRIMEGSPAERCGQLRVGDQIVAVNHINIMNFHHGDIVNLIKDSGYTVTLTIDSPVDDCMSTTSAPTSHKEEDIMVGEYHAVELTRGSRGFGFSIRGGKEFQNMSLFVLQIAENGPAAVGGNLRVGDKIIEINGTNTKNMTHAEAIEIIRNGGPTVRLLVQRGGRIPPVLPNDEHLVSSALEHITNGVHCLTNETKPMTSASGRTDYWNSSLIN